MKRLFSLSKQHLLPLVLLVAATVAVYWPVHRHDFLVSWDDNVYVTANEAVRGLTAAHLREAFTSFYSGNYAPLQIVSYMLDYTLWGLRAGRFLVTNLILHLLNGLLLYTVVLRLHGRRIWAFLASFLFLLHPVQVESVAWVSQRKNVLAMFFLLVSLRLYLSYRGKEGEPGKMVYTASLAAFAAALATKAVTVFLPLVLVPLDLIFFARPWRRSLADKAPYLAAALLFGAVTYVSQDPASGGGRAEYWGGSLPATLVTMVPVAARYLGMLLWPLRLSPAYEQPFKEGIDAEVALAGAVLLTLATGAVFLFRRQPRLAFWLLFALLAFLPVSQVVPLVTLMNDRYLYFPLAGFASFAAGAVTLAGDHLPSCRRRFLAGGVMLVLLPLPLISRQQVGAWENSRTLWTRAVQHEPESSLAWLGLGHALMYDGYTAAALDALLRSYALFPDDQDTLLNLGLVYQRLRDPVSARPYLLRLRRLNPRHVEGLTTLADSYLATGDPRNAEEAFRSALSVSGENSAIAVALGRLCLKDGRLGEARTFFAAAISAGDPAAGEYGLAAVAARSGDNEEALRRLEEALRDGFRGFFALRRDPDFASLVGTGSFGRLLQRYGDGP